MLALLHQFFTGNYLTTMEYIIEQNSLS